MNELILLKKVQRKAKLLFTELYLNTVHEFKDSKCWFTRMCRRNNLLHHRVTSAGQQIPKNGVEFEIEVFTREVHVRNRSNYTKRIWSLNACMA